MKQVKGTELLDGAHRCNRLNDGMEVEVAWGRCRMSHGIDVVRSDEGGRGDILLATKSWKVFHGRNEHRVK